MKKFILLLLLLYGCASLFYQPAQVVYLTAVLESGDTVRVIQVKDNYKTSYFVPPCN